jgi:hypothetical protein
MNGNLSDVYKSFRLGILLLLSLGRVLDVIRLATVHLAPLGSRAELVIAKVLLDVADTVSGPGSSGHAQVHHDRDLFEAERLGVGTSKNER